MEIKDLLQYLDIKEDQVKDGDKFSLDKFKEAFNGDGGFFRKNQLKDIVKGDQQLMSEITGSRVGSIDTALNRAAKALGVEFDDETGKQGVEKKLDFVVKTHSKKINDELSSLKKELELKDVDAAVKEYKDRYSKLESKFNDTKGLLEKTVGDLENERKGRAEFEKSLKITGAHQGALSKIKFAKDVDELKKEGFLSILSKNYKLDIDENGQVIPLTQEGKRIPNQMVSGKFLEVEELYQLEAVKNNLIAKEGTEKFAKFGERTTVKVDSNDGTRPERKTFREVH